RGTFYGCERAGELVGVGLVGEWFSTSGPPETLRPFARAARRLHGGRARVVIVGEGHEAKFERVFGRVAAQRETQVLLVKDDEDDAQTFAPLRPARPFELEEVARAHVRACVESNADDPSERDPEGFRRRLLARIRSGRVWIVSDAAGRVIFKTDIAVETDEAAYLEAVWTAPDLRGQGLGARAVGELSRRLLGCYRAVCLFADADKPHLLAFYQRLGFQVHSRYSLLRY
ncbi:MAG TPA: GNAT family N-acetyltransferase, partial [Pyrinomonadaceae bacterium]|nr:GNAT family N-acetyltransferase [Pyrinomonadaceae bacterium]